MFTGEIGKEAILNMVKNRMEGYKDDRIKPFF